LTREQPFSASHALIKGWLEADIVAGLIIARPERPSVVLRTRFTIICLKKSQIKVWALLHVGLF
jgi:hypothetical protein